MNKVYLHGRETPYFDTLLTCHPLSDPKLESMEPSTFPKEDQEIYLSEEDFTQLSH